MRQRKPQRPLYHPIIQRKNRIRAVFCGKNQTPRKSLLARNSELVDDNHVREIENVAYELVVHAFPVSIIR